MFRFDQTNREQGDESGLRLTVEGQQLHTRLLLIESKLVQASDAMRLVEQFVDQRFEFARGTAIATFALARPITQPPTRSVNRRKVTAVLAPIVNVWSSDSA